jgi:hypothetical protein
MIYKEYILRPARSVFYPYLPHRGLFFVMALGGLLDDVLNIISFVPAVAYSSLFPSLRIRAHRRLRSPATTTGWGCPCYPWTDPCMDSRVARSSSPEATNWDFLELWRPCRIRVERELDPRCPQARGSAEDRPGLRRAPMTRAWARIGRPRAAVRKGRRAWRGFRGRDVDRWRVASVDGAGGVNLGSSLGRWGWRWRGKGRVEVKRRRREWSTALPASKPRGRHVHLRMALGRPGRLHKSWVGGTWANCSMLYSEMEACYYCIFRVGGTWANCFTFSSFGIFRERWFDLFSLMQPTIVSASVRRNPVWLQTLGNPN